MYAQLIFSVHIVFVCLLQDFAQAHLGESCKFGLCTNALFVPIQNAFCDKNNICQCNDGYIIVGRHKCSTPPRYSDSCESDNACKYTDENLICDRSRFKSVCECRKSFIYDYSQKKCVPQIKKPKSTPLFPITAVIFIACIGIFCGCGIICHNFRRQPELSINVDQLRRAQRIQNSNVAGPARNPPGPTNSAATVNETQIHPPLLRSDSHSSSCKYDSLLYDDPPPKYEDAISDLPPQVVIESQVKRPRMVGVKQM